MDEGYARLSDHDFTGALKVARVLRKRRHTSHFEIAARAYWELDRQKKAIAVFAKARRLRRQFR